MNYSAHYERLMERARTRRPPDGYIERHHVIPVCIGGINSVSNIVILSAEEHYVAHQLLVKIYPGVRGLLHAAIRMSKQCTGNKAYGWLRRALAKSMRGKKHSQETRAKMRAASPWKGQQRPPFTVEHRAKLSENRKTYFASEETKAKISRALKGRPKPPVSDETRKKISASRKGKTLSASTRAAMSNANKGRVFSETHRQNISLGRRGKQISADAKRRIGRSHAKLTLDDATRVRDQYAAGGVSQKKLAEIYGVTHATIWRIVSGAAYTYFEASEPYSRGTNAG